MTFDYQTPTQPDILEVIADLSNDEVRTPPSVANAVLDLLPAEVWTDSTLRWLDPGVKTGVFLREITKRLLIGLAEEIPDENKRLEHILKNQVFGIAITELTGLMGRRTLYCSKDASSERSIVKMDTPSGNLWFERTRHLFAKGRCTVCGASEEKFDTEANENYAYAFIHEYGRLRYEEEHQMKFDIIVGNPPYQMEGGAGGTSASPLYQEFVMFAQSLLPRFVLMVIPSRWMAGGRGLEEFRESMLKQRKITHLADFPDAKELFPGIELKGGVCYFLWDRDHSGNAQMTISRGGATHGPVERDFSEFDVLVRDSRALEILRKVMSRKEISISRSISGNTPFGLATNFKSYWSQPRRKTGELELHLFSEGKRKIVYVNSEVVSKNRQLIDSWKVFLPAAYGAGETVPHQILGHSILGKPKAICTQTFLFLGPFESEQAAASAQRFLSTRFARFLVSLRKISQDAQASVYGWVPVQTWDREWTDAELYKKYGITKDEQAYIESMIKEMPA
jgi:site-specific DNA-methyltransferase (adenine-specific)